MKHLILLFALGLPLVAQQSPPDLRYTDPMTWDAEWVGEAGRVYFPQWSPDLGQWVYLPTMRFGEAVHGIGGSALAGMGFVRLAYYDDASLADLTAAELADHDHDGLPNLTEITETFTDPYNSDSDGDGISDGGESDQGSDPNDPDDTPEAEWFILTGDLGVDEEKSRSRKITIPAGETRLVAIVLHSEEYPYYTSDASEFNDILQWTVTPDAGEAVSGSVNVNSRHAQFEEAEVEGVEVQFRSPAHIEELKSFTAPADAPLVVDLELSATNIGDGALPSTVMVGLLPVVIIVPKVDSEGNQIDGEFIDAKELKVAKWEDAFEGTTSTGSVKDDFIGWDKDRFYVHVREGDLIGLTAVKIASEDCPDPSYNDDPTVVLMSADENDAISDSMILVSDDDDDDFAGSGAGADDQENDRTHKVQLGGNCVIKSVLIAGTEHAVNIKIPVPIRKIISVDFIRMNVNGVRPLAEIEQAVVLVNERYAQVGLRVNVTIKELPWPNLPNRPPGYLKLFNSPPDMMVGPLTDEYKSFIDQTGSNGVNIFFLLSAYPSDGIALNPWQLQHESGELNGNYLDKAFVHFSSNSAGGTSAHELAHLLAYRTDGVNDHAEAFWNLLNVTNVNQEPPVLWSKRLSGVQQNRIDQHPGVQNP